ncbi:hypothetical protein PHPALM_31010 [Phytophthora palmivora]|uniref:Integrase catalytic domain-containing protein n=1 Tax=Phytophthora palmivora TaxID=4796 RepID=A0A2P4X3N9_9STRA|nr:hypothetical protein PHPALM_31010 [Phytophthora palmivora]
MVVVIRPAQPAFTSAQVAGFYFRPCRDDYDDAIVKYFRCRCGIVRKQTRRNGYTNLMHVRSEHPNFEAEMLDATTAETGSLMGYVQRTSQNLYGWLDRIVKNNLPLTFCENRAARRLSRLTRTERAALKPFEVSSLSAADNTKEGERDSFVERLQKRRRLEQKEQQYQMLSSIPPTSNVVERFFSIAWLTFGHEHNAMHSMTHEQILFLRQNESYWDWVSDQGSHFKNLVMEELATLLGVQHHFVTAYCPWANGTVEVVNRQLLKCLRSLLSGRKIPPARWVSVLRVVRTALNHQSADRLGNRAPVTAFTGLPATTPVSVIFKSKN